MVLINCRKTFPFFQFSSPGASDTQEDFVTETSSALCAKQKHTNVATLSAAKLTTMLTAAPAMPHHRINNTAESRPMGAAMALEIRSNWGFWDARSDAENPIANPFITGINAKIGIKYA